MAALVPEMFRSRKETRDGHALEGKAAICALQRSTAVIRSHVSRPGNNLYASVALDCGKVCEALMPLPCTNWTVSGNLLGSGKLEKPRQAKEHLSGGPSQELQRARNVAADFLHNGGQKNY